MRVVEVHEYKFPSYLLPALINNEPVIDEDEDRDCFNRFINELEEYKVEYCATSYIIDYEANSYFSKSNCLNNLGCDVTDIKVIFFK